MNKRLLYSAAGLLGAVIVLLLVKTPDGSSNGNGMDVSNLMSGEHNEGFSKAIDVRPFQFPADHGPHPEFSTEWWYITGNLWDQHQHRYGYQLTFFRRALSPQLTINTGWQDNNVYMAHFAISNHQTKAFFFSEKFGRNGAGVAGAQATPFRVWLDDWEIQSVRDDAFFPLRLRAKNAKLALELTLDTDKPMVLQGDRGLSKKSAEPGNASYYYSFTRLKTTGTVRTNTSSATAVSGASWLDREWSTSALSEKQQGWDWFALQLHSGEELMFYRIRNKDGSANTFSSGVWVDSAGQSTALGPASVTLTALKYWNKDHHQYPVQWRMQITTDKINKDWIISAALEDQLLDLSVRYWEGAVDVIDYNSQDNRGVGFLEMTGY